MNKLIQSLHLVALIRFYNKIYAYIYSLAFLIQYSFQQRKRWFWIFKFIRIAVICIGVLFFLRTFVYNVNIIGLNSPQEYREDSIVLITERILEGKPIFSASSMPTYANWYGMSYSYVVAAFAKIWGNSYTLHRFVTTLLLFVCYLFIYKLARKVGGDRLAAVLGIIIFYYFAAFSPYETGPRPDSLGLLLFLFTVFAPWLRNFSYPSLIFSVLTSIIAFYTKPYFVLGIVYVGIYLLLTRRIKKSFVFAEIWIISFVLVALWVNRNYDFYFYNTLIIPERVIVYMGWWLKLQTIDYIIANLALFITSLTAIIITLRGYIRVKYLHLTQSNAHMINNPPIYFIICLLISWIIIIGRFGGNAGSYLTYYNQLISPFMLLIALSYFRKNKSIILVTLLGLSILIIFFQAHFNVDTKMISQNRNEWEKYLSNFHSVFPIPPFSYYIYNHGMEVYDAGDAEYFLQNQRKQDTGGQYGVASTIYNSTIKDFEQKVMSNKFDLIMYMVPYTTGVDSLLYSGYIRNYIEKHYRNMGIKMWITSVNRSAIELWVPQQQPTPTGI